MPAPKGNKFWEARSTHGRNPIFPSPDALWGACVEYFEWVDENPLYEVRTFAFQGTVTQEPVAKMRAMTIAGLCNFLDIGMSTWDDYRSREDFSDVCSRVEQFIRQQKFEGASAELLNPSIIARDLGLTDTQKVVGSGPDGEHKHKVEADAAFAEFAGILGRVASIKSSGTGGEG